MKSMLRALAFAGAIFAVSVPAHAQQPASGAVQANATSGAAPMRAVTPTEWIDRWCSSTQSAFPVRGASTWACSIYGSGVATWLVTPSSANLRSALTDETGTGSAVFGTAPTIAGGSITGLTAFGIRSTGASFDVRFAATEVLTADRTLTWVLGDAARTITLGGNITTAGAFAMSGAFGFTGTLTNTTTVTFPTTGTLATLAGSETLTNKTFVCANQASCVVRIGTDVSGLGTGIATALAVNTGSAGAPVLFNGALGTPSSGTLTSATGLPISTGVSGLGTGIATALAVNTGSAGAPVLFNGALGTPTSGTVTNLTGTASININGTVGATSQNSGQFTSIAYSTTLTGTSTNANALAVGRQGATNPVLQVDASTATVATGLKIKGAAAAGGLALSVITSGTNENLTIDAAGSGTITLGGTSTGAITLTRATTASVSISSPIHAASGSLTFQSNGSTFAGLINTSQQLVYGANQTVGATPTIVLTKNGSSVTNPIYANAIMQLVNVDGTGTQIAMDAYGAAVSNGIQVRHARGTQASPTATQNTDTLWSFVANGYYVTGGPAFGTLDSIFSNEALENFTSTARGNAWRFYTSAVGAAGAAQRMQVASGVSIGTSTDPGVGRLLLTSYAQTGTTTVGSLPTCNAGTKGARFFVTDANATTFHTTAAGGGANNMGVTCDGTNWYLSSLPSNDNMRNYAQASTLYRAAAA